jgi:hypothetical protein
MSFAAFGPEFIKMAMFVIVLLLSDEFKISKK